jgi:hypothetical protein
MAISVSAGTAAREYAPTWVSFQISVASVSKPIGRRRSVAGSSFMAERNTSAAPASMPLRASGTVTRPSV